MKINSFIANNDKLEIKKMSDRERYFIYIISDSKSNIVYVGKTTSLHVRIMTHKKRMDVGSVYFFETTKQKHCQEEQRLIKELTPKHNITHNPRGIAHTQKSAAKKRWMHINTPKIKAEMKRLKLTYAAIGQLHNPKITREAAYAMVHNARRLDTTTWLASVLGIEDPRDLILDGDRGSPEH